MTAANYLNVTCVNGIVESDLKKFLFLIYLLDTIKGIYIGETKDLVTRWHFHNNSALKEGIDRGCNDNLKEALKYGNVKVYIIATARTEEEARAIEALAIQYYGASLNSRKEVILPNVRAYFNDLDRVSDTVTLKAKRNHGNNDKYCDSDRNLVVCKIVVEKSRKRVLCCQGPHSGIYVECSRSERDKFNIGDLVKIKAVLTYKRDKPYLVAAKTSILTKA